MQNNIPLSPSYFPNAPSALVQWSALWRLKHYMHHVIMQMLMWVWFSAWWRLSKTTQFYCSPKKVKDRLQRSTVLRHMTHSKKLSTDTCSVTCERPDRCALPDGRVACRAAGPPAGPGSWAWSRWRPWWGSFQTDGRRGRSPPHYELKHHTHKHTCVI